MKKKFTMLLASLFLVMGTTWAQVVGTLGEPTTTLTDGNYVLVAMSEKGIGPCYYHKDGDSRHYRYDLSKSINPGDEVTSDYVWTVDETTEGDVQHITVTNFADNTKFFVKDAAKNQNFGGSEKASLKVEKKTISEKDYIALTLDDAAIGYIHANAPGGNPNLSYWDGYGDNGTAVKFVFYPVVANVVPNVYMVDATTGTGLAAGGWKKDWAFTPTESHLAALKLTCPANNMTFVQGDASIHMYAGQSKTCEYTLSVPSTYKIVSYSFDFVQATVYNSADLTLTVGENTYHPTAEVQTVEVSDINATSTTFTLSDNNKGIKVMNFKVTIHANASKPGERKSTFAVGDEMFIYSTCRVNGNGSDFTGFLTNKNNSTTLTKAKPNSLISVADDNLIWVVASVEEKTADGGEKFCQVTLKNKATGGYWGIGGATNNASVGVNQTINIWQWNSAVLDGDAEKAGGDVWSENEDGTALQQSDITDDAPIFAVQAGNNQCMNTSGSSYNANRVAYPIVFYTVADANEEVSTKIADLNGAVSSAESVLETTELSLSPIALQVTNPTGAGYIKCSNLDPDEGNDMAYLIDNNPSTYIHSNWHSVSSEKDYLEVYLGEGNGLSLFRFTETTRSGVANDFAASIEILGSKDGESFVPVTTVTGLPTAAGVEYASPAIECDPSYVYLRFVVTGSKYAADRPYFHMAEFDLYSIEINEASKGRASFYVALNDEVAKAKGSIEKMDVANMDASKALLETYVVNSSKTYPFALTADDGTPALYAIKSGRTNADKGWWYTYDAADGKIGLTQFTMADTQYWYFKEAAKNGNLYLELYPYAGDGSAMSYTGTGSAAGSVMVASKQTEKYSTLWQLEIGNGKYGLQTENKENRLSNNGGVDYKMGMWNDSPDNDGGSAMYLFEKPKYPFTLTSDDANPKLYAIKSGRGDAYWYTYVTEGDDAGKIALAAYTGDNLQKWYFKEVASDKNAFGLQLYPAAGEGKAMSYQGTGNGAGTVVAQAVGTEGWKSTWILETTNGAAPYGLQTEGKENRLSNNGGVSNKMGMWNAAPNADGGTAMYFVDPELEAAKATLNEKINELVAYKENATGALGYYAALEQAGAEALDAAIAAAKSILDKSSSNLSDCEGALETLKTVVSEIGADSTIVLPEAGKYYRIGYDFGSEVGVRYMESVNSSVSGKENALNMSSDAEGLSTIFYYADGKLQSLDTKKYLKENNEGRGLHDDGGAITFSAGNTLGKIKIQATSYLHANVSGDVYFIDRCGSDGGHAQHNFVVKELSAEDVNGAYLQGCTYVTALDYTTNSNRPFIVNNARSNWAVADEAVALSTLNMLSLVKDVADTKQQFAIITPDNGENYYLYSVHAERYLKSNNTFGAQGEPIAFADASEKGDNKVQVRFRDVAQRYINVGGSNQITIDWWSTIDEGNACELVQCNTLTFDLDKALDIFNNGADITVTYKVGDHQLTTTTYKKKGETYSFSNPYAFTTVTSCKKDGEDLEATEGTYSFDITGDAHIIVELQDNLPFRYAASYDKIEHWYFMKIRDDGFTYMGYDAEKAYIRANQSTVPAESKDAYTWGFVGNPFEGFSIVNYATGKTKVLSAPVAPNENKHADQLARMVEVTKEYTGNLVWNIKAPTHGSPQPGVFYIEHPTATSYAFNRQSYDGANALCYWNQRDTGSAIQVEERGVFNLSDLTNNGVYLLQAERSPLMYSTTEGMTTKLSSGLVDTVSVNEKDVNQHFLFLRTANTPEEYFYLYSVGAKKFVDENLNFVDFPSPVLSLEAYNGTNSTVYPWWVKINGKYVIPAEGGNNGNKIYHVPGGDDDEGKRYRIVKVGQSSDNSPLAKIEEAEEMIKTISELSNDKVYTVSTLDRGNWYHYSEKDSLWSTHKVGVAPEAKDANQQFAFLTVAGHTYIYSLGAKKFVVKAGGYTTYSDTPSQAIEFLDAKGSKFYPFVAAFVNGKDRHHIGISNSYSTPVITFYNDLNDGGNKIKIREVASDQMADGAADKLAAAVAVIDAYLAAQELKPELEVLIAEAEALLAKNYLDTEDTEKLTSTKVAAKTVYEDPAAKTDALIEQIELLTDAIAVATYVRDAKEFKNTYVYTFVTKRGWVGADANSDNLIGTVNSKVDPAPTPSEDNPMFQWAVYKSANENYYLYNIGKGMFMGNPNGEPIPFAATPQSQDLTFKRHDNANWADYPIMFSPDNKGVVSQNGNAGLFYWNGGWNKTDDDGSNHKVTIVGQIPTASLTAIAEAVEAYEAHGEAVQGLREYLNWFMASYHDAWAPTDYKWRDQAGVNNYTIGLDNALTLEEYYNNAKSVLDAQESTIDALNGQKNLLESVVGAMTINQPEAGKFYRLRCVGGSKLYLSSDISEERFEMQSQDGSTPDHMFMYDGEALLSYSQGLYVSHHNFNALGVKSTVVFAEAANDSKGQYNIKVGDRYIYGRGNTQNNHVDSGTGNPTNKNEDGYNWWLEEVTELPVGISSAGYTTLYAPVALEISEDVDAYVVSEVQSESVLLTKVTGVVPAETALIIKGEEGDYAFGIRTAEDVTAVIATNALKGTVAKSLITPADGYTCYVLAKKDDKVGLYKATLNKNDNTAFLNNACKVYLPVANPPVGQAARALAFRFGRDNEGTTDLEKSEIRNEKSEMIFDLTGRRIEKIVEKGMYIVNGKKVIFR